VVGEAADGREALAMARELRPDVVLMDVRMPGMDGLEATRQLLSGRDAPRVLMLTTFDLDEYVYDALLAGASGFLLKDVRPEQLADAVRIVADGDTLLAPAITQRLVQQYVRRVRPGTTWPAGVTTPSVSIGLQCKSGCLASVLQQLQPCRASLTARSSSRTGSTRSGWRGSKARGRLLTGTGLATAAASSNGIYKHPGILHQEDAATRPKVASCCGPARVLC
jgi:CheY-like chemotaxis protein